MFDANDLTLHAVLARLGWKTEPALFYRKRITDAAGALVGDAMTAHEAWQELRRRGLIL